MCSVNIHILRFNCGLFSHSSFVHDPETITYHLVVTPEMYEAASISRSVKATFFENNFNLLIALKEKNQSNLNYDVETG